MSIGKFLLRRTAQGIVVVWGVVTVLFVLRAVSPTDPATLILGQGATQDLIETVRREEGLNRPIYVQYIDFLTDMLPVELNSPFAAGQSVADTVTVSGVDLGYSWRSERDITDVVLERVPATLELTIAATIVAMTLAIPLGVISATRRGSNSDYAATMFSLLGISTPNFWLGLMMILVFGVWYGLPYPALTQTSVPVGGISLTVPVGIELFEFVPGRRDVGFGEAIGTLLTEQSVDGLVNWLRHITLPAITLGTYFTALITRLTRSGMIDEIGKAYVLATQAKGLPGTLVRYKHVLRNTMIPIVTVLGLQMGTLLGGAVVTETVFNWPGIGQRLIRALGVRDWPTMQGIIIFVAVGFVFINIIVDTLYAYLDPQVSVQ